MVLLGVIATVLTVGVIAVFLMIWLASLKERLK